MSIIKSSLKNLPQSTSACMEVPVNGFFCSKKWYENFITTVIDRTNEQAIFYCDIDRSSLVWPLLISNESSIRKIKSLTNYYSPLYSIFYKQSDFDVGLVCDSIVDFKDQLPLWDILELRPLSIEDKDLLMRAFKKLNMKAVSFFCFGNWYLTVNNRSFEEYYAGLPSKLQNTVKRKSKKFFQIDGARIDIITSQQGLLEGIACYEQVYSSSWKTEEPYPEFMSGLMKIAESVGSLRLGIAYIQDQPIAAQVWIVADKTAYIYKLAYDEAYKQYSAGSILTTKLMEHVINVDKVEVVDYLTGDDDYKKDWMSNRRERWGILVFNTSTVGGIFEYFKEIAKSRIKQFEFIRSFIKNKS